MNEAPVLPQEIETESFRRIEAAVGPVTLPPEQWAVVSRMIHSSADPEYLQTIRFHPQAVAAGVAALKAGRPVFTDVRMLLAGISGGRLARLKVTAHCLIDAPEVREAALAQGITRAAAAVDLALPRAAGGIMAIGNAPTALRRVLLRLEQGWAPPALIVGIPVGFVDAAESKAALAESPYTFITALGPKGGSAVAASVINALAILALEEGT